MLVAYAYSMQSKPPKIMLSCLFTAQGITSSLDRNCPRNLDLIVSVNTLSALLLTKINRSDEALEFILAAESHLATLIEFNIEGKPHSRMLDYLEKKHRAQEEYCRLKNGRAGS